MSSSPWHDRTLSWLVILLFFSTIAAILAAVALSASPPPAVLEPVNIRILAVNDFHGQLPPARP